MQVEVWSDIVCPWCYIGKRRLETALARFDHRDEVELVWRSIQLDPTAPRRVHGDPADRLARKYAVTREQAAAAHANMTAVAAEEGLHFQFDISKPGNTFDAHRLLHLARDRGIQGTVKEKLMAAYFEAGEPIGDSETLLRLVAEVGIDIDEARGVLDSDKYADEVRSDEREAAEIGIGGVPFFVFDGKYGISGAQPADLLLRVLSRSWAETQPFQVVEGTAGSDSTRSGEGCAI